MSVLVGIFKQAVGPRAIENGPNWSCRYAYTNLQTLKTLVFEERLHKRRQRRSKDIEKQPREDIEQKKKITYVMSKRQKERDRSEGEN